LNVLTKIAIVVLLVVTLFACPVFITQAVVPANYRIAYENQITQTLLHSQDAQAARLALKRTEAELRDLANSAQESRQTAEKDIEKLQSDLTAQQTENTQLKSRIDVMAASLKSLEEQAKLDVELRKQMQTQLADARHDIEKRTGQISELKKALSDMTATAERYEKLNRVLEERIAELKDQIAGLEERIAILQAGGVRGPDASATEVSLGPEARVEGTITAIGANDTASINIGSAKGIQKDMKLYVYRGSQFVGYFRVGMVEADQAVGIIVEKQLDVKQGDKVSNKLQY